jgi:hypothetical protein
MCGRFPQKLSSSEFVVLFPRERRALARCADRQQTLNAADDLELDEPLEAG